MKIEKHFILFYFISFWLDPKRTKKSRRF